MTMRRAKRQMSASADRSGVGQGKAFSDPVSDEATRPRPEPKITVPGLLDATLARENMQQAWKRVGPIRAQLVSTGWTSNRPLYGCAANGPRSGNNC
jgi:hypothetical protein